MSFSAIEAGEYVNMVKAGIIDPLPAFSDAASVLSLLKTTEAVMVKLPKDEKATSSSMAGTGVMYY